jgi:hypothetical protein
MWFVSPILIIGVGGTWYAAHRYGLTGGPLVAVGVLATVASAAMGLRSWLGGITITDDQVIVTKTFRSLRIPRENVREFRWEMMGAADPDALPPGARKESAPAGLVVVWKDPAPGGSLRKTPVAPFNKLVNPTADLERGHEVWEELRKLTVIENRRSVSRLDKPRDRPRRNSDDRPRAR